MTIEMPAPDLTGGDPNVALVEIHSDGLAYATQICVDGKMVVGVTRVELDIEANGFATATLTIEGVRVRWRASMAPVDE